MGFFSALVSNDEDAESDQSVIEPLSYEKRFHTWLHANILSPAGRFYEKRERMKQEKLQTDQQQI